MKTPRPVGIQGTQVSFRLSHEQYELMSELKTRDGIPLSEQLRRGLEMWIASKLVPATPRKKKAGRK